MSDFAVRVDGLGKQYHIGGLQTGYRTLRDSLVDSIVSPFRRARRLLRGEAIGAADLQERFWALKDISFDVKHGEVVGIVGPNGAGKTTLLKVLSRITEPTRGSVEIRGRVGSLLEVGTGFHPELTGRENTYLYGAILGMKKTEIDRKFDEIVAFADIPQFLDTPVKHYSSGMYIRLAFAVAAHLEPEILIVDEVLAVGDMKFQKKCLGKMENVANEGRTVFFVSHNLVAVQNLCQRAIWLQKGEIVQDDKPANVIEQYIKSVSSTLTEQVWEQQEDAPGNHLIRLRAVRVKPEHGSASDRLDVETPVMIEVEFWNLDPGAHLHVTLHVENAYGIFVFESGSVRDLTWKGQPYPRGLFRSVCRIPGNLLNTGGYSIKVLFVKDQGRVIYLHQKSLIFDVHDSARTREGWYGQTQGVVRPKLDWSTELLESEPANAAS